MHLRSFIAGGRIATLLAPVFVVGCAPVLKPESGLELCHVDLDPRRTILAPRALLRNDEFRYILRNLKIEDVPPGERQIGDVRRGDHLLGDSDIINVSQGEHGTVDVRARLRSPFADNDPKGWIGQYHRVELPMAVAPPILTDPGDPCSAEPKKPWVTFHDRLIGSIETEATNVTGRPVRLSPGARQRVRDEARVPIESYVSTLTTHRGFAVQRPDAGGGGRYVAQYLLPGDLLSFDGASGVASIYREFKSKSYSTREPGPIGTRRWGVLPWWGVGPLPASTRNASGVSVGTDPLALVTPDFKDLTNTDPNPPEIGFFEQGRLLGTTDAADWGLHAPYSAAILLTQNVTSDIPYGPSGDLRDTPANVGGKSHSEKSGMILLFRDHRASEYLLKQIRNAINPCVVHIPGLEGEDAHHYVIAHVFNWARDAGLIEVSGNVNSWYANHWLRSGAYTDWVRIVQTPLNTRAFIQFSVLLNGQAEPARTGETLLGLIDRRGSVSDPVFRRRAGRLRADELAELENELLNAEEDEQVAARVEAMLLAAREESELIAAQEEELIESITRRIRLSRRTTEGRVEINLSGATRLEDLLIPLLPGDQITWRD